MVKYGERVQTHVFITPSIHRIAHRARRNGATKQSRTRLCRNLLLSPLRNQRRDLTRTSAAPAEIATKDFGLHWIELRSMWNKNITDLDAKEIAESKRILEKYQLRVTDIASPLFKVDWPGAPLSKEQPPARPVPRRL